jgi:hypothetical protein
VQQPGSRLSGPTTFAHGQQTVLKSYVINKPMIEKTIDVIQSVLAESMPLSAIKANSHQRFQAGFGQRVIKRTAITIRSRNIEVTEPETSSRVEKLE